MPTEFPRKGISRKQKLVHDVVFQGGVQKLKLFLIGAIGTAKTYAMALIFITICREYEDSYIPVGRTTLADARVGTVQTFIEVLNDLGLQEGKHYRIIGRYAGNTLSIIFLENNSVINFLPMDVTRDRDSKKLKSIPATTVGVDEVDSVAKQLFTDLAIS